MPGWSDPKTQVQIPCEIDVTTDISPSKIRASFAKINIPKDKDLKILANQADIDRWCNEGIVVRSVEIVGKSDDDMLLARRGPVKMCGFEMVPMEDAQPGKLTLVNA
jgi:hypothetical protein